MRGFSPPPTRPAHDDDKRSEPAAEEWLLVEWPEGANEPDHYWLCTLSADIPLERTVDQAKLRWRIERDYLELKQEVGLGHYEGRGWRGFHHHASLCIAAYGFLISEKETIPPPRDLPLTGASRDLPFPQVTDPGDLPLRSQHCMPPQSPRCASASHATWFILSHDVPVTAVCHRTERVNDFDTSGFVI